MRHSDEFSAVEPPAPAITTIGNLVCREYRIPAGMKVWSHTHDYDHLSILMSGKALLSNGSLISELDGPFMVEIRAGIVHEISAVTDCVWDCISAFKDTA